MGNYGNILFQNFQESTFFKCPFQKGVQYTLNLKNAYTHKPLK